MPLPEVYFQVYGQLREVLRMSEGQAPEKFTRRYIKDLGLHSSNFHAPIPLLKGLWPSLMANRPRDITPIAITLRLPVSHLPLPALTVVNIKTQTSMNATLPRSDDRTFSSALRALRRAEPDAAVMVGT